MLTSNMNRNCPLFLCVFAHFANFALKIKGILLLILLLSCNPSVTKKHYEVQEICGRDAAHTPIYRVRVPNGWIRTDPTDEQMISDTTKALCEFHITDNYGDTIRITIHNFPTEDSQSRISPEAQVTRWKKQFKRLEAFTVSPQAHGGFFGLLVQAQGEQNGKPIAVTAWAMQIGTEHYAMLSNRQQPNATQMKAEYTIKATGSSKLMNLHHTEIIEFGNSFELIQEIPTAS